MEPAECASDLAYDAQQRGRRPWARRRALWQILAGRPLEPDLAHGRRAVVADDGLQHSTRPHLHVLEGETALRFRLRAELHYLRIRSPEPWRTQREGRRRR